MAVNGARLNRLIQIRRNFGTEPDAFGNIVGDWRDHGPPIFARRHDVSDAERMSAGRWNNKLVARFVIRDTAFGRDIRRSDKLVHGGITYGIDGIKEVPPGRAFLEITAETEDAP